MSQPTWSYARTVGGSPLLGRAGIRAVPGRRSIIASRALLVLIVSFLLFDGAARLVGLGPYVDGTVKYGYPESFARGIALTLLLSTLLYAIPRTAVLGAILLTAYLGGAVASHLRVGESFLFPIVFGVLAWLSLYLRDQGVRALVLWRERE